jgi:hypothetical protein
LYHPVTHDRDHRAKTPGVRTLTAVGEPMLAIAFGTDGARLDVGGAYSGPIQEQRVGRCQREPVAKGTSGDWGLGFHLEGLIGISSGNLTPGVSDVVPDVVAATTNGRTKKDVSVIGPCAKGSGHDGERCANDIRDSSPPSGVDNADGRTATPGAGIDDQYRLAVGMQRHQHGADLVGHERIAQPDLCRRPSGCRLGATSGVRHRGDLDVP